MILHRIIKAIINYTSISLNRPCYIYLGDSEYVSFIKEVRKLFIVKRNIKGYILFAGCAVVRVYKNKHFNIG